MTWSKFDDGYDDNPKVFRAVEKAGDLAQLYHFRSVIYANKHRTDGHIPAGALAWLGRNNRPAQRKKVVAALLDEGLWEEVEGGWLVHDFDKYNKAAAQLKKEEEQRAERVARHRAKARVDETPLQQRANSARRARGGPDKRAGNARSRNGPPVPVPVPDPSPGSLGSELEDSPPPGGGGEVDVQKLTRILVDMQIPQDIAADVADATAARAVDGDVTSPTSYAFTRAKKLLDKRIQETGDKAERGRLAERANAAVTAYERGES